MKVSLSTYTLWTLVSSVAVLAAPSPIAGTETHNLVRRGELASKLEKAPSNCHGYHRFECHNYYKRVRAAWYEMLDDIERTHFRAELLSTRSTPIGHKAMALESALSNFGLAHQPGLYPKILKYANLNEVESERQRVEARLMDAENAFGELIATIRDNRLPDLADPVVESDLDFPNIKKVVRFYYDLMFAANKKKSHLSGIEKVIEELPGPGGLF